MQFFSFKYRSSNRYSDFMFFDIILASIPGGFSRLSTLTGKIFGCLLIISIFAPVAHADQTDRGVGIYLDQDMFVPRTNEDRDYTMGMAFEFFWSEKKGLYLFDNLVRQTGKLLGMSDSDNNLVYSVMLGTLAYTPDDLSDPQPIFDDRPYASLIFLSNKRVRADDKNAVGAEVMLGIIGTDFSKNAQTKLHSIYREIAGTDEPVEPQGWDHQISDGGELTMRLRLSNSRLQFSDPGVWDLSTTLGLSLGFQTNASVGLAFRVGDIKSQFWSLPFDPITRGNFLPSRSTNEWYFWSAFRTHLIAYDVLLQGQFKDSKVTFSSDEIERLVYDGAIGLTFGFDKSQLSFSVNGKTSDLKIINRNQFWGGINYVIHF